MESQNKQRSLIMLGCLTIACYTNSVDSYEHTQYGNRIKRFLFVHNATVDDYVTKICTSDLVTPTKLHFPFPGDDKYFIECGDHGRGYIKPCGSGLVWNEKKQTCDWPPLTTKPISTLGKTTLLTTTKPTSPSSLLHSSSSMQPSTTATAASSVYVSTKSSKNNTFSKTSFLTTTKSSSPSSLLQSSSSMQPSMQPSTTATAASSVSVSTKTSKNNTLTPPIGPTLHLGASKSSYKTSAVSATTPHFHLNTSNKQTRQHSTTIQPTTSSPKLSGNSTVAFSNTSGTIWTTSPNSSISQSLRTTTIAKAVTTTKPPPYTIPSLTTKCKVCSGPEILCEKLFVEKDCNPPNNYCVNTITNKKDGSRLVNRRCDNFQTCYRDWFLGSSDNDKCRQFDEHQTLTLQFTCTFCCIKDNCNLSLRPIDETLYKAL